MSQAQKIRQYLLTEVSQNPKNLVANAIQHFNVTNTTVHRHLNKLIKEGKILKTGRKRGTKYFLAGSLHQTLLFKIKEKPEEHKVWDQYLSKSFIPIPKNLNDICYYGFGEMFNNAVDHSEGEEVKVRFNVGSKDIQIEVYDDGIGVFRKIQNHLKFEDIRESALHLSKGKLTTSPQAHSGEGIFFTSRVFDEYSIYANGILYVRDNTQNDWFIEDRDNTQESGTLVTMKISRQSQKQLEDVFAEYQNPETFTFDKTHIMVKFSQLGEERFVSRSQAKRILSSIDKFSHIILDFEGVRSVGQAFADEVFRVFQNAHPDISIEPIHMTTSVEFMIKRSLATAQKNQSRN